MSTLRPSRKRTALAWGALLTCIACTSASTGDNAHAGGTGGSTPNSGKGGTNSDSSSGAAGSSSGGVAASAGSSGMAGTPATSGNAGSGGGAGSAETAGTGGGAGTGGDASRGPKGVSGWLYDNDAALAAELASYDSAVQTKPDGAERRVRYLFPYGGGIGLTGSTYAPGALSYDPAAAAFYADKLPGADMLPNIDSGDGELLASFSQADQEQLANDVAQAIVGDPHARGVHIDIEPFRDQHAPFYAKLKTLLHASQKQLTLFTGRTSGPVYSTADIVVLSGYDLGIDPVTPVKYGSTLSNLVTTALASAAAGGSTLLVGIPVSASYEEYSTQSGTCSVATGVTQEQWVTAALKAVCPHQADHNYLGISLWQVGNNALEIHAEPGCLRHPDGISDAVWSLLEDFDPAQCP